MSTIKSSAENLTLNADGANNDIKFQSNGSEVASIDQAGSLVLSGNLTSLGIDDNATSTAITIKSDETVGVRNTDPTPYNGVGIHIGDGSTSTASLALEDDEKQWDVYVNGGMVLRNTTSNRNMLELAEEDGDVTVSTGDLIFGTAGKGIVLGATTNVDANTLDDYEEGTFSPTLYGTGTAGSPTYTSQFGKYTKIGNVVSCYIRITTSALGGIDGLVRIGNLPFTSEATADVFSSTACGYAAGLAITAGTYVSGWVADSSTYIKITNWDSTAGTTYLDDAEWSDDGTLMISVVYHT